MADYPIHKGVNKPVEFKGLQSQYLFIFAVGLRALFVLVVIMIVAGVSQLFCLGFGATLGTVMVVVIYRLNGKYGAHGLMKLAASKRHPRRIINRKCIRHLIKS